MGSQDLQQRHRGQRGVGDNGCKSKIRRFNAARETTGEIRISYVFYTAKAHTTGGREGGTSWTDDGRLERHFTTPGQGNGTNPEQLFAAGWSTCFLSSIKLVAGKKKINLPDELTVDAEVDLGLSHGGHFDIAGRLQVRIPGMDRQAAQELVDAAHQVCAYSRATRGNIDVAINVV